MNKGAVRWFNSQKGCGFTTNEKSRMGIPVHFSGIASNDFRSLEEGRAVIFDITNSPGSLQAVNVYAV